MDQIIETLEKTLVLIDSLGNTRYCVTGEMHPDQRNIEDNLTVLVGNFKDAKQWVEAWTTHHAEGEPVAHLVEDPSSGETLADPPATEENNLHDLVKRGVTESESEDDDFDVDESDSDSDDSITSQDWEEGMIAMEKHLLANGWIKCE